MKKSLHEQGCEDGEKGAFDSAWQEDFLEEVLPEMAFKGVYRSEWQSGIWSSHFAQIYHDPLSAHNCQARHWLVAPRLGSLGPSVRDTLSSHPPRLG